MDIDSDNGCNYCSLVLKKDSCVFCRYFTFYRIGCRECDACRDATPSNALELNRVSWKSKDNYCRECGRRLT